MVTLQTNLVRTGQQQNVSTKTFEYGLSAVPHLAAQPCLLPVVSQNAATCKYLSEQPVARVVRVARSFAAGFSIVLLEYGVVYPAGMPVMQAATDQNRCAGRLSKTVKLNPDLSNVIGKFRIRRSLFFTGRWRRIYITRPLVLARIRFQGFRMARSSSLKKQSDGLSTFGMHEETSLVEM